MVGDGTAVGVTEGTTAVPVAVAVREGTAAGATFVGVDVAVGGLGVSDGVAETGNVGVAVGSAAMFAREHQARARGRPDRGSTEITETSSQVYCVHVVLSRPDRGSTERGFCH